MTRKMLWCSDSFMLPTGYSQVTRNILGGLHKANFDIHHLAFQNVGFPTTFMVSDRMVAPYNMYTMLHPGENYGNMGSAEFYSQELKPDITAFLCDSFMIKWISDNIERNGNKLTKRANIHGQTLFYFPFDSNEVYEGAEDVMKQIDIRVAMSKFGQKVLKDGTGMDSHYIPHGVDPTIYRTLPKHVVDSVKKQNKWEDKFIVGSVARNQSRKNIPALYKSFAKFAEGKDDVILLMHCDPADPQGSNLNDLARKLGISEKVSYGMKRFSLGVPESRINLAYNIMDIHALSTTGEGFGLPIIESMATGTPNICTDCTTANELLGDWGIKVPLAKGHPYIVGQLNTDRALIDIDKMSSAFEKMYNDSNLVKKYGDKGKKHVIENYNWSKIIKMWVSLLEHGDANAI